MRDGWCSVCGVKTGFVGICHACAYKFAGPEGLYPPKIVAAARQWFGAEESLTDSPKPAYGVKRFSHTRSPRMDLKITLVIDLSDRLASSLSALLSGGAAPVERAAPLASAPAVSAAEPASTTTAGATPATEPAAETSTRGRRGANKPAAAASTPASQTSPGDVFANPGASAPTAATPAGALTGDVFSQQIATANAEAAAPAASAQLAAENPVYDAKAVGDKVSQLLPTLGPKGLKKILGDFTKADGTPVTVLRELQEGDFVDFMEALNLVG